MQKTRWLWTSAAALSLCTGIAMAQPAAPPPGHPPPPPGADRSARREPPPPGKPGDPPGKPGDPPGKPGDLPGKPGDLPGKPGDLPGKPGDPPGKPGDRDGQDGKGNEGRPADPAAHPPRQGDGDRPARRRKQVEDARAKVAAAVLRRPMDETLREELRRHAERVARLERIQAVAEENGDTAAVARVKKLLEQENARHAAALAARK